MTLPAELRVATRNPGKLRELGEMLSPLGVRVRGTEDLPDFEVVEDGATFEANAIKKAATLAQRCGAPALADDSGLVVDALDGAPGIYSARYAGVEGPGADAANRRALLRALAGVPPERRTARFVCALAYVEPGQAPITFGGTLEGHIGHDERGTGGFGYDCIFFPVGSERTTAEMSPDEKNAISHRGRALDAFVRWLSARR